MTDNDYIIFIKHELNSTYTSHTNWLNPISLHFYHCTAIVYSYADMGS